MIEAAERITARLHVLSLLLLDCYKDSSISRRPRSSCLLTSCSTIHSTFAWLELSMRYFLLFHWMGQIGTKYILFFIRTNYTSSSPDSFAIQQPSNIIYVHGEDFQIFIHTLFISIKSFLCRRQFFIKGGRASLRSLRLQKYYDNCIVVRWKYWY